MSEKIKSNDKKTQEDKKFRRFVILTITILLAVVIVISTFTIIGNYRLRTNYYVGIKTAATSDTYTIDNSMMSFFIYDYYNSFVAYHGSEYLMKNGFDTSKSAKAQKYNDSKTWFNYFVGETQTRLSAYIAFAEKARAEGFSLTDAQKSAIEQKAKKISKSGSYASWLNRDDIYKCLEIELIGTKYIQSIVDSASYDDISVNEEYNLCYQKYNACDYIFYSFPYTSGTITEDSAKEAADELAKTTSVDDFKAYLTKYLSDNNMEPNTDNFASYGQKGVGYNENSEPSVWMFADTTVLYDTYVYKNTSSSCFSVFMLTKQPYKDESETVNIRTISLLAGSYKSDEAAKQAADIILGEYNSGEKTAEAFANLALEYSDDGDTFLSDGVYDYVPRGRLNYEFDTWAFDSNRKNGDTTIIKSDSGYTIVYFETSSTAVWYGKVVDSLKASLYSKTLSELSQQYQVNYNLENINEINL